MNQSILDAILYEASYQLSKRFDYREDRTTWLGCTVVEYLLDEGKCESCRSSSEWERGMRDTPHCRNHETYQDCCDWCKREAWQQLVLEQPANPKVGRGYKTRGGIDMIPRKVIPRPGKITVTVECPVYQHDARKLQDQECNCPLTVDVWVENEVDDDGGMVTDYDITEVYAPVCGHVELTDGLYEVVRAAVLDGE